MAVCVLDTDVVIAALDRDDAHHAAAATAFERFTTRKTELVICTVNYAEALVRPAEDDRSLRAAVDAIASLRIRTSSPDAALARVAARRRALGISLADGFALATAERMGADLASFDRRVRRALDSVDVRLSPALMN
ncbi:MAG TPA: PIN domain-containing protein [Solirubrobacterales bacterium]|nr:PIN domain-containing protein [Solirubrobacterales bacterium]